ncbi:hypothetical protein GCM10009691_32960 [Brevibacterium picturae]|uniref:Uncharacterized protein n=1 Tax=Brevibacterium picturae TaxID=260553 RepID=A0ABN2CDY3_9MICO
MDQDLRGDAGDVDAGSPDHGIRLLDDGDALAGSGHGPGQGLSTLAPANDEEVYVLVRIDVVIVLGHDRSFPADDALVVSLLRSGQPQMSPRLVDVRAIELGFPRVEFIVKLAFHGR